MSSFPTENEHLPSSPPMAVLPLNPSAKLDQEPNPFEQSFSSLSTEGDDRRDTTTARSAARAANDDSATSSKNNDNSHSNSSSDSSDNGSSSSGPSSGGDHTTTTTTRTIADKPSLPSVADLTSPVPAPPLIGGGILPKDVTNHLAWDSLRTGPLSPSMLQGPLNPAEFCTIAVTNPAVVPAPYLSAAQRPPPLMDGVGIDPLSTTSTFGVPTMQRQSNTYTSARSSSLSSTASVPSLTSTATVGESVSAESTTTLTTSKPSPPSSTSFSRRNPRRKAAAAAAAAEQQNNQQDEEAPKAAPRKRARTSAGKEEDDEKRRNFLERNRIAALKCRQRKKQWLNDLQKKVECLTTDNEQLQMQANTLREELINLKTLLLAHKDCPVSRAQEAATGAGASPIACSSSVSPPPPPPATTTMQQHHHHHSAVMSFSVASQHHQPPPAASAPSLVAGTAGVLRF